MVEDLDAIVRPLADEHPAAGIDGNRVQRAELARCIASPSPRLDKGPIAGELHHAVVRIGTVTIRDENVAVVRHHNATGRIEVVRTAAWNSGRAQPHEHFTLGVELDDLVPAGSLGRTHRAHRVGHPHVTVRVYIDSVRPYEHTATEALHNIAVRVELQNRVQIRVQTLIPESPRLSRITPDHRPDMLSIRIDVHPANGAHLPAVG